MPRWVAGANTCRAARELLPFKQPSIRTHAAAPGNHRAPVCAIQHNPATRLRSVPTIRVVALITAKPGLRAQVLEAFAANRPAVLAELGCLEYQATVDAAGLPPSKGSLGEDCFAMIQCSVSPCQVLMATRPAGSQKKACGGVAVLAKAHHQHCLRTAPCHKPFSGFHKCLARRKTAPEWATLADLQAHAASPHMQAYGAQTRDWLASRVIHVLEPA